MALSQLAVGTLPGFLKDIPIVNFLPHFSCQISSVNSSLPVEILVPRLVHTSGPVCLSPGICSCRTSSLWFSLISDFSQVLLHPPSTASNASALFQLISLDAGVSLASAFPPHCRSSLDFALFLHLPYFFCHTQSCVYPYNSFCWLRTPASILPMICENCVFVFPMHLWTEMHALDIHLLLCHLGSPQSFPFKSTSLSLFVI